MQANSFEKNENCDKRKYLHGENVIRESTREIGLRFDYRRVNEAQLRSCSKGELIHLITSLSARVVNLESDTSDLTAQLSAKKVAQVNQTANQPTSKMPEFDKRKAKGEKKIKRKKTTIKELKVISSLNINLHKYLAKMEVLKLMSCPYVLN